MRKSYKHIPINERLRTLNAQRKITPELYIQIYCLFLKDKF